MALRSVPRAPVDCPGTNLPSGTLATHEKVTIEAVLKGSKGRVAGPFGAAVRLGVPSSTLESKIKALKIDKRRFKSGQPSVDLARDSPRDMLKG